MTQIKFVIILLISMILFCGCKKTEHIEIEYGKTFELVNGTLTSYDGVTWSSNNENVASIEGGKTISANGPGSAIVRGMKDNKTVIDYNVDVILVPIEKIELSESETEMNVGDTKSLTYTLSPNNASDYGVKWVSDDETVVTVNEKGTITAVNAGTACIKAISDDGVESSKFKVVVEKQPEFPNPEKYGYTLFSAAQIAKVEAGYDEREVGKCIYSFAQNFGMKHPDDSVQYDAILKNNGFDLDLETLDSDDMTSYNYIWIVKYKGKAVATLSLYSKISLTSGLDYIYTLREMPEDAE